MKLIENWEHKLSHNQKNQVIKELLTQVEGYESTFNKKFEEAKKQMQGQIIDLNDQIVNLRTEEKKLQDERNIRFNFISARARTGKRLARILKESDELLAILNEPLDNFYSRVAVSHKVED